MLPGTMYNNNSNNNINLDIFNIPFTFTYKFQLINVNGGFEGWEKVYCKLGYYLITNG